MAGSKPASPVAWERGQDQGCLVSTRDVWLDAIA